MATSTSQGRSYTTRNNYRGNKDELWNAAAWESTKGAFSAGAAGAGVGASIGWDPISKGVGAAIGFIGGLIFGGLHSNNKYKQQVRDQRESLINQRDSAQSARNDLIYSGKTLVGTTRSNIDSTYGAGTFNEFNDLFAQIFNMPTGTSTLSTFLDNMQYDKVGGVIESSVLDGGFSMGGQMSLSDISNSYLEYLRGQIGSANTAFGMQIQGMESQEKYLVSDYFDSVDAYNQQIARQFSSAFLNRKSEQVSGELSLGQAAVEQASSGIRVDGASSATLTNLQKFQNDLADIAYASSIDYMIKSYEMNMSNTNSSMLQQIESIRRQKNQSTLDAITGIINGYNSMNSNAGTTMGKIKDQQEYVEETNKDIMDANEYLKGSSSNDNKKFEVIY